MSLVDYVITVITVRSENWSASCACQLVGSAWPNCTPSDSTVHQYNTNISHNTNIVQDIMVKHYALW